MLFAISTPFPLVQQPVLVMPAQVGSFEKKSVSALCRETDTLLITWFES